MHPTQQKMPTAAKVLLGILLLYAAIAGGAAVYYGYSSLICENSGKREQMRLAAFVNVGILFVALIFAFGVLRRVGFLWRIWCAMVSVGFLASAIGAFTARSFATFLPIVVVMCVLATISYWPTVRSWCTRAEIIAKHPGPVSATNANDIEASS